MTIYYYSLRIYRNPTPFNENKFKTDEYEPIAENKYLLVLNSSAFTRLGKVRYHGDYQINKPKFWVYNGTSFCSEPGFRFTLYTDKKKRISTIKKMIEKRIKDEIGYICDIDLSIIK